MARELFGGSSDDYAADANGRALPNRRIRFYTSAAMTTEITDLASDAAGTGAPLSVSTDAHGFWGPVYGPDAVTVMYAGAADGAGNPPAYVVAVYTHSPPAGGVATFNGRAGVVSLSKADVTATALAASDVGAQNVVVHGATAGTARPAGATVVHWIGSVAPSNAATNDEWTDTTSKLLKRWNGSSFDALGSAASLPSTTGQAFRVLRVKSDESGPEWAPASRAVVNVKFYGAKGDGISLADGATTSGSPTLTSAGATFTAADIGKLIYVYNGSATFSSTIAAVVDAHTVTMAANCTFTGTARYFSYATDDSAAIAAAISVLGTAAVDNSKILYFPRTAGWYADTAQHSFDHTDNITILGDTVKSWPNDNLVQRPAADWRYMGNAASSTSFISARGSVGFTLDGMGLRPDSPSFAGTLLNLAGDGTRHTFSFRVRASYIGDARSNQSNVIGVQVGATVLGTFEGCTFDYMGNQIACSDATGGTFANVITFRDCAWSHYYQNAIYIPTGVLPTQWLFDACTFEFGVFSTQAFTVNQAGAFTFLNTGFWDTGGNTAGWINQTGASTLKGWTFTGCYWEINATGFAFALKSVDGMVVQGNRFYAPSGTPSVFKTGSTITNLVYRGNQHENVTDNSWIAPGGVQAWFAADGALWQDTARTTAATTDATAVATWDDATGNANHIAQATAANRPLLKTAILNGKPVLRFDGTNDTLTLATWVSGAGAALAQPNVIFAVAKPSSGTSATIVDSGVGQTGEHVIGVTNGTPSLHQAYAGTAISAGTEQQVFVVREVVFNGTAAAALTNGSLDAAANVGTNTMQGVTIGSNVTPSSFLNGDVAEVIVLHGAQWLDAEARNRVRRYLASKYALSLVA